MKESIGHTAHIISLLEQCKNVTFYQNDAIYSEMCEAALDVICLLSDMTIYLCCLVPCMRQHSSPQKATIIKSRDRMTVPFFNINQVKHQTG